MRFERWLEDDDAAWDAVCDAHDDLLQTSAVSRAASVFGAATRRIRVLDDAGRPLAAVAILEVGSRRAPAADRVLTRRFEVQGGPLLLSDDPGAADAAVLAVEAFAHERGAVETQWKPTWPVVGNLLPFAGHGWETRTFGTAWRPLPAKADDVLMTFETPHRSAARQAQREGMRVRPAKNLDEMAGLLDASYVRSGLAPRNREFIDTLHAGLAARGAALLTVCEDGVGPAAGVFAGRCGRAVFVVFAGRADRPTRGASNLAHLRALEHAVAAGATRAHDSDAALEDGTGEPAPEGITRFKRFMGFRVDPCPLGRLVHRPVTRRVRDAAFGMYRHLRGTPR
jgi:hypothetical protein